MENSSILKTTIILFRDTTNVTRNLNSPEKMSSAIVQRRKAFEDIWLSYEKPEYFWGCLTCFLKRDSNIVKKT